MSLSLNDRAAAICDRMAADAEGLRIAVTQVGGARVIDCGAKAPGGYAAGIAFAEACMGGLGTITLAPVLVGERPMPGVAVTTDHPAAACLAAQYAGWKLEDDDFFAMASGPGRALVRAEDLYDDLRHEETASTCVLALETGSAVPEAVVAKVAERAGLDPSAVTLLVAPTACITGGVQVAARVVETALHKLHELDFDVHAIVAASGSCPLPPVAKDDGAAIGRTNDAVLYGGSVHLTVDADDDVLEDLVPRLPSSGSSDFGTPFGETLKAANWDFYEIDPLLFSPAAVAVTSTRSGRTHLAGGIATDVLERSFFPS